MITIKFTKEYWEKHSVKDGDFGPGPWSEEPDKANWVDESTSLPCMIVRNHSGTLCGYVGVPLDSKLADIPYDSEALDFVDCHGGLTYGARCNGNLICHDGPEVYWFGFDTAHYGDYSPLLAKWFPDLRMMSDLADYKTFEYVKKEVTQLAAQIKKELDK